MRIRFFLLIFSAVFISCNLRSFCRAAELLNLKNLKKEYSYKATAKKENIKSKALEIRPKETVKKERFKIVYLSNTNLFVKPLYDNYPEANYQTVWPFLRERPAAGEINFDVNSKDPYFYGLTEQGRKIISRKLVDAPNMNGVILYKESQLLLQESIREIVKSLPLEAVDMVVFGGNQVYSNDQMDIFTDIAVELQKYQVPYYEVVGENEKRGAKDLHKYIKDYYYLLRTKGTSIIVLDNSEGSVVPERLPEEASKQYIWFKSTLESLSRTNEDVLIFSYKALDKRTIALINNYPQLTLKLVAHSGETTSAFEDNQKTFVHKSNPVIMTNTRISAYPCAYTVISRDSAGRYKIEEIPIGLKGIRELAKARMK